MKVKTLMIATFSLIVVGTVAEGYNLAHHQEMALSKCKTEHNIDYVDSKGFKCKTPQTP